MAPRTPVEEAVAGIWTEVLGLERVGIHDNFFDLGGHSLLATQVMSRVRETFRVDLPLRTLFESATVASLALAIGHSRDNLGESDTIEKTGSREDLLSQVDRISDREVNALLGGLLAENQR